MTFRTQPSFETEASSNSEMAYLQVQWWEKMRVLGWIMCSIGAQVSIYLLKNDVYLFGGVNIYQATTNGRFQFAAFVHKILSTYAHFFLETFFHIL